MDRDDIIVHWKKSASEDQATAEALFVSKHYHWCLFLWHLTLEKLLKALITKQDKEVPFTHNLLHLARVTQIPLSELDEAELKEITTFNLEARYDDYKLSFYKKASEAYTKDWVQKCLCWVQKLQILL